MTNEFLSQEAKFLSSISTKRLCAIWEYFAKSGSEAAWLATCRISDELERRNHDEFMDWQYAGDSGDVSYMTPSLFFSATPASECKI